MDIITKDQKTIKCTTGLQNESRPNQTDGQTILQITD